MNTKSIVLSMLAVCGTGQAATTDFTRNTTLNVPADYPTIPAALTFVNSHRIVAPAIVTIKIADGTYDEPANIFTHDAQDAFVHIIGNVGAPARVVLNFANRGTNLPAFSAEQGGQFGLIDGVTINGVGGHIGGSHWNAASFGAAFYVDGPSSIYAGAHVVVNNFFYGVLADEGGTFNGQAGFTVNGAGDAGYLARHNGVIDCPGCIAMGAGWTGSGPNGGKDVLGWNFLAEEGGDLEIDGATGSGAQIACIGSIYNGKGWARHVDCSRAQQEGVLADFGGVLDIAHGNFHDNSGPGVVAQRGGRLSIDGTISQNNRGEGFLASGGTIEGHGAIARGNGSYGFNAIVQGFLRAFGALAGSRDNAKGLSHVDAGMPCKSAASTDCDGPSGITVN